MRLHSPGSHVWSLGDQAMVSGTNFVSGILLARFLGLEAFGAYVVAQTYLLYANTFLASLVVAPMMTAVPAIEAGAARTRALRGFFAYACLVVLFSVLLVQGAAALLGLWSDSLALASLALPLAAAMTAFLLQDWGRRALYASVANRAVFLADIVAYGGQVLALLGLGLAAQLSAERALWVMAGCFSCSAAVILAGQRWRPDLASGREVMARHWRSSRDFFASWQLQWLGSSGVILFGTGLIGPQAAGAIRAAQNLLGPVNVGFQWMDNVIPVRAASRLRAQGRAGHVRAVFGAGAGAT